VSELTAQQEARHLKPWTLSDAPADYIRTMLRAILGFRIPITRPEGKVKMSQNRDKEDKEGIERGLMDRHEGRSHSSSSITSGHP
jgi:transcriptional regulator